MKLLSRLFRRRPLPPDVFRGTERSIRLAPGWECDHSRWRWERIAENSADGTVTLGLVVFTSRVSTGEERWVPVGQGIPFYMHGETFGCMPGTWKQETRVIPVESVEALTFTESLL